MMQKSDLAHSIPSLGSLGLAARDRDATTISPAQQLRAETVAMGRLAAGAAYEIEGPLSSLLVSLRATLASRATDAEPELLSDLNAAVRAAEQIEDTVRGLRAFTALEEDPRGVDVHEAIELAAHFARGEIASHATLRRHYAATPRARGSTAALTSVLFALLRNAAESIPGAMPWANDVAVRTSVTPDGLVAIEVTDTGAGIEPEDLPFVFDPFFTTKPTPTSPGLGLASARAAVLAMGGALLVESVVGRGSRFRVLLPALESAEPPLPGFFETEEPDARRVLCVAETALEARRLRELLDDGEARLLFATCGETLERLALGEEFDLIVCDAAASTRLAFRERLARLAPHALSRSFELALRSSASGTFTLIDTARRAAANGDGS